MNRYTKNEINARVAKIIGCSPIRYVDDPAKGVSRVKCGCGNILMLAPHSDDWEGDTLMDYCGDDGYAIDALQHIGDYDIRMEQKGGDWEVLIGRSAGVFNGFDARASSRTGSLSRSICYAILKLHGQMLTDEELEGIEVAA